MNFYRVSILACLLSLFFSVASAGAATVNVKDYRAVGNGVADDSASINAAIAAAIKMGKGTVLVIPPGTYMLLGRKNVRIDGAEGLTIKGDRKKTFLVEDDPNTAVITVDNCTDTTIQSLVLEQSQYHFTQGKVVAQDYTAHTVDILLDPGFPEVDDPLVHWNDHWTIDVVASTTSGRYEGPPYFGIAPKSVVKVADRTWRLAFSDFRGWPAAGRDIDVLGKHILIWNDRYSGHGIDAGMDTNLSVDHVTYYGKGANAMFILWHNKGRVLIDNCVNSVVPGSNAVLSCSGGGQFIVRGQLDFEHCDFEHFDDDGADVLSDYMRVIQQQDNRTIVVQNAGGIQAGDHLSILDAFTYNETSSPTVISTSPLPGGDVTVTVDRDLPKLHAGVGDDHNRETDGVDRVGDYDEVPDLIVQNCTFQCNRARPLNLKARSATIVGCVFKNGDMPAIAAGPEMYWGEGPTVHNYTITGNTFIGIRDASIAVGIFDVDSSHCQGTPLSNITITNNHFVDYGSSGAITIKNTRHIVITGNTFGKPHSPLLPGAHAINLNNCEDVAATNNHGAGP